MARTALTPDDELAVLRQFARGADIAGIDTDLGFTRDQVADVIQAIGFNRARAGELVRQRDAKRKPTGTPSPAGAGLKPPAARETVQPPAAPSRPARVPAAAPPSPEPQQPDPGIIEDLLQRAEAIPRLRTRAARIRELLESLAVDIEQAAAKAAEIAEAERHVAKLKEQLDTASRALRDLTRPKAAAATNAEPLPSDIRAWAAEHDLECPASGRIPNHIRQQFNTARSAA
jgi:hypothetical protein